MDCVSLILVAGGSCLILVVGLVIGYRCGIGKPPIALPKSPFAKKDPLGPFPFKPQVKA